MTDPDEQDWFERLEEWLVQFPGRSVLLLVVSGLAIVVAAKIAAAEKVAAAQNEHTAMAIYRHMGWLQGLPDAEKRRWQVRSYCHPGAAPRGKCECEAYVSKSEVSWPERLENGDIACHVQK